MAVKILKIIFWPLIVFDRWLEKLADAPSAEENDGGLASPGTKGIWWRT